MRNPLLSIVLAFVGLAALCGCQMRDQAISATPSLEELPDLKAPEPVSVARVGVDSWNNPPTRVIVPRYEKIEPTPEERAILGEKDPPEVDLLVFAEMENLSSRGLLLTEHSWVGSGGMAGPAVGLSMPWPLAGQAEATRRPSLVSQFNRPPAGTVGIPREPIARAGGAWSVQIGRGEARQPAARTYSRTRW